MENYYISLSQRILALAKSGEDTSSLRKELYYVKQSFLVKRLDTDDLKIEFWQNIYNAYFIIISQEPKLKISVYKRKRIKIMHSLLSLDEIEYGILKKPKYKFDYFNLNALFYSGIVKKLAVSKFDTNFKLDKVV